MKNKNTAFLGSIKNIERVRDVVFTQYSGQYNGKVAAGGKARYFSFRC